MICIGNNLIVDEASSRTVQRSGVFINRPTSTRFGKRYEFSIGHQRSIRRSDRMRLNLMNGCRDRDQVLNTALQYGDEATEYNG